VRKVHILGSGGREHAIGWAFRRCGFEVHYYPGNAGTAKDGVNHSYDGYILLKNYLTNSGTFPLPMCSKPMVLLEVKVF